MQVYEIGVVGCLAQEEMTLPGIPGPSPVGPSLLHPLLFPLFPTSLEAGPSYPYCHFAYNYINSQGHEALVC